MLTFMFVYHTDYTSEASYLLQDDSSTRRMILP